MSALRKQASTAPETPPTADTRRQKPHLRALVPAAALAIPIDVLRCRALDGNEKIVYATLRNHEIDPSTGEPWRQEDLADFLGIARSTLTRVLRRLCSVGLLKMTRVGLRIPNRYYPQPLDAATTDLHRSSESRQDALVEGRRRLAELRTQPPSEPEFTLLTAHNERSEIQGTPRMTAHHEASNPLTVSDPSSTLPSPLIAHDEASSVDGTLEPAHNESSHTPTTAAAAEQTRTVRLRLLADDLGVNFTAQQIRTIVATHGDATFDRVIGQWCEHREAIRQAKGATSAAKIAARFIRDGEGVPADLSRLTRRRTWTPPDTDTTSRSEPTTPEIALDLTGIPARILTRAQSLGLVQGTAPFMGFVATALKHE